MVTETNGGKDEIKLDEVLPVIDVARIANLEIATWRAHNNAEHALMASLFIEYNMSLYGIKKEVADQILPIMLEVVRFHDSGESEKSVDAAVRYYDLIKMNTDLKFDPKKIAELEIEWWKTHDELGKSKNIDDLAQVFTDLYSGIYGVGMEDLIRAGKLKAEATIEHDLAEDPLTLSSEVEGHWDKAKELLVSFYLEIGTALGNG